MITFLRTTQKKNPMGVTLNRKETNTQLAQEYMEKHEESEVKERIKRTELQLQCSEAEQDSRVEYLGGYGRRERVVPARLFLWIDSIALDFLSHKVAS